MLSVNSLVLAVTIVAVGLSSACVFFPGDSISPALAQNHTQAEVFSGHVRKNPLSLRVGQLQVRWMPKGSELVVGQADTQRSDDSINSLTRAVIVVAMAIAIILTITFLHSMFEAHAREIAKLESQIAGLEGEKDALSAELNLIKGERERALRANVLAVALARTINKVEARDNIMNVWSVFKTWKADAQKSAALAKKHKENIAAIENKRQTDALLRTHILGSLENMKAPSLQRGGSSSLSMNSHF
ncbi:hypothetical protein AB1Y20_014995 [Prymnesium parvum]|uniref:Biogenesis of lysosome-related organelles complex 1 subunit 1 n=1 Tax=Prymnesium parvum TaxID=97485 RepID=A0AB34JZG7_PRYPA